MHRALELPANIDLSDLSYFLYGQNVPHKISEESGRQVIWTPDAEVSELVVSLYSQWQEGGLDLHKAPPRKGLNPKGFIRNIPWKQLPVTMGIMVICMIVAAVTQLGSSWDMITYFTFVPFHISGNHLYFDSFSSAMAEGEYWRTITPIFLHFGFAHLAFNMLSLFIFGSRLEYRQGGLHLLLIILTTGLLSNFAQYFWGGEETIFGGFSGVVYGLMGYCMVRQKVDKNWPFDIPPIFYGFMLIWLVIGYTGILGVVGFGNMANAAHSGGLIAGALLGAVAGILFRGKSEEIVR
ncbi:hypothetical protein ACH42_04095 [Endozoicomonas sp. (ex Bugula neritina AB1)]|nr:hypothetical protein ACH42_04095 [Endozoicomonas sp. (ex Bugula neritina AB1)]